jgi:LuxR family maltose regulon positive regulatory protein
MRLDATSRPLDGGTLIRRSRLVSLLHDAAPGQLTVLAAPAGYGKSVLLDQWVIAGQQPPLVRVSFRRGGGSWTGGAATGVTANMLRIGDVQAEADGRLAALWPTNQGAVQSLRSPLDERALLNRVVDELGRLGEAVLVLDGWDAVAQPWLRDQVTRWIESPPRQIHIVLAQRNCELETLDELSHHHRPTVIGERQLAFEPDEAQQFLRDVSGQALSDEYLELLLDRTEGWPVGLQLAAIGLRDAPDPEDYVVRFALREDRHVAAYLCGEVLRWEPASVRRFLMQTSVLSQLTPSLCDAVTGDSNGSIMLRRLIERGLFVRPTGGEGKWLSYHGLFRDLLRRELRVGEPAAETQFLSRAAAWHGSHNQPEQAARYLIEAEKWQDVIDLTDRYGSSMLDRGQAGTMLSWLRAIPVSTDPENVEVGLRRAYLHVAIGETGHAAQITHELKAHDRTFGQQVAIDALEAICASLDSAPEIAIRAAEAALAALKELDPSAIPNLLGVTSSTSLSLIAAASRARAMFYSGDFAASRQILSNLVRQRRANGPWLPHVLSALALIEAWSGNLRLARVHALRACTVAGRAGLIDLPAVLDARLAAAHVLRERNDLPSAGVRLDEAEAIARRHPRPMAFARYAVERSLWQLASGQPELGLAEIDRGRAAGEALLSEAVMAWLQVAEARILLAMGEIERTEAIIAGSGLCPVSPELNCVAVRAALAQHNLELARGRLKAWPLEGAETRGRLQRALCAAIIDFESGDRSQAVQLAADVLRSAEEEGHVRLFLDLGRPAERLLRALVHASSSPYARYILTSAHNSLADEATLGLSKRELEVVRYLPTPLSSTEIAARLYISLNTLKTHLRTIYGKLGVRGRRDAIERVEELGIA